MVRRLTDELGGTATVQAKPTGGTVVVHITLNGARKQMRPDHRRLGLVEDDP
jgi:hypothetical protein